MKLTINKLRQEALNFCKHESTITHEDLFGITDGKAIGTYIEHKFEEYLKRKYEITIGSSAKGIDLPDYDINTDIKVTSVKKPQNSSPFDNVETKIYGLGHNLLIFIYEKTDINNKCYIDFKNCLFIEAEKTGDYHLTKILRLLHKNNAEKKDFSEVLKDYNVPGDDEILNQIANKIISNPPKQGYLTISNAFQWRLKYSNVLNLKEKIDGIYNYEKYYEKKYGDYQTPLYITDIICEYLKNNLKIKPDIIIEPSCGRGNFLHSASKNFPKTEIYGIEIDKNKLDNVNQDISNIKLINEDILMFDFDKIDKNNSILIIGNLSTISNNKLSNIDFKNYSTETARNQNLNSQHLILKLIETFKHHNSTIALLCKNIAARNIFIELMKKEIDYSFIKQLNLNSNKIKKDTCLFIIQFGGKTLKDKSCEISDITDPSKVLQRFGFISEKFYSNINDATLIEGECQFEWYHGVKHDCAKIMELKYENNKLINKNNDTVSIEHTLTYPFLKSGDIKKPIVNETSKYIIITQKKIKQNTDYIKTQAPKTWKYLIENEKYFNERKSAIYNNTPKFSIFGIGDYSFKKYKVAIAGFSKEPIFSLVYTGDYKKTMMLDDACYFLSFDNYDDAYITMLILNSDLVKKFLKNIAFMDSKRPFSKKILKRIDVKKCLNLISFEDLKEVECKLKLNTYLSEITFEKYKHQHV